MVLTLHIKEPLVKLRTLVSQSSAFQSLVGAADAAAALGSVHYGYAEDIERFDEHAAKVVKPYPRAIVATEDYTSEKTTTGNYTSTILLSLLLEAETPDAQWQLELGGRYLWWLAKVEAIVDDLRTLTADQTQLLIESYDISIAPQRRDPDTTDLERWVAAWTMEVQT